METGDVLNETAEKGRHQLGVVKPGIFDDFERIPLDAEYCKLSDEMLSFKVFLQR